MNAAHDMRPKVVRSRGFLFYPIKRAGSSAIQLAMGYDFIDWNVCQSNYDSFHRFTCYRNTFDRLRSLYYNFVALGSPQGPVDFGIPTPLGIKFHDWILEVCRPNDSSCNEHLHSQDWHRIVPDITIYRFEKDLERIFHMLGAKPEQLGPRTPEEILSTAFSPNSLRAIERRYGDEIAHMAYLPPPA